MGVRQWFRHRLTEAADEAALADLTDEQAEALLEALLLAAYGNGHLAEPEFEALLAFVLRVPALQRQGAAWVRAHAERQRQRLTSLDPAAFETAVVRAAESLPPTVHEAALRRVARICLVDGAADPYERDVLKTFARAWGIAEARAREIFDEETAQEG